jgi:hypothetical protein
MRVWVPINDWSKKNNVGGRHCVGCGEQVDSMPIGCTEGRHAAYWRWRSDRKRERAARDAEKRPKHKPGEMRVCVHCTVERPVVLFARVSGKFKDYCELCYSEAKEWRRSNNAQRWAIVSQRRRLSIRRRAHYLVVKAKKRAEELSVEWGLDDDWALEKLKDGHCEVTGMPFILETGAARNQFCPSIDRIDSSLGYTKNNCRMVSWIFNRAKGEGTDGDVEVMARALCGLATLEDVEHFSALQRRETRLALKVAPKMAAPRVSRETTMVADSL